MKSQPGWHPRSPHWNQRVQGYPLARWHCREDVTSFPFQNPWRHPGAKPGCAGEMIPAGHPYCVLHRADSKAQASPRKLGPLVRSRIVITEDWKVQGNTCSLVRNNLMVTGLTFHQAHFWEDTELLASPCLGAADHPALWHILGGAVLFLMLPPNGTSASTASQALAFRNFFLIPFLNIELNIPREIRGDVLNNG